MITLPETNRSVKAVLFIYCCKGVSAGYCFLVKRIFAPAAHEKVWIFHYVKKLFIKGTLLLTFAGLLSRLMGFFYRIFLSHTIGAHGLGIFQLILPLQILIMSICASGIQTAISRLTAAEKVSKNPSRHISDYFCRGNCIFCCFLPGILLVSLQLCGFLGSTDSERVTDLRSDTDSFSEYSVEYTSYLYQQLLFGKKTGRISRRSPASGTAFPHRRMLYSLSDLCIARAKHHSGNCSRRKSYRGNSLIFISLFRSQYAF